MKVYYFLIVFLIVAHVSIAQRVTNVRAQAKGNLVYITYDLIGTIRGQVYNVSVFSSHNGKIKPLAHVRGDVGQNLSPSRNKVIEWGAKKELSNYEGEVTLEVRATLVYSPIRFTVPQSNTVYKRGHSYNVGWLGAIAEENLQLELYNDSTKLLNLGRITNKGTFQWDIPLETKPGKNYKLKVSSVDKPENFAYSSPFVIKRKVPIVLKVVPIGMISSLAVVWILNSIEPKGPLEDDLPLPPGPQ